MSSATTDIPVAKRPVPANDAANAVEVAGQWQLMWWKFTRHKVAVVAGVIIILLYFVGAFAEVLAPTDPNKNSAAFKYIPPQTIHLFEQGTWNFFPHVNGFSYKTDPRSFRRTYVEDPAKPVPIGLFVQGTPYKMWNLFTWDRHLIGPIKKTDPFFLLGSDRLGRDNLSRIIHGTRISMSVGLVGVTISLVLGLILGGISGYYGGRIDTAIQRLVEFLRSMPTIPLWMGLAAAIPLAWPPLYVYLIITALLSLIGWTSLAREVRGRVMAVRNEDFVTAARLDGVTEMTIITRQILPSFASHIIAVTTLAIPEMILAETALSFLGIGLQTPVVSWGVLLREAQNITTVANAPWLLWPGIFVVVTVLAFNFLGDGLRDAADPYAHS
ncbi:MAG TPA: ABC transporter permease [Devosiaceae bacterium]|jgi:peptide/nickel transport system permease protein